MAFLFALVLIALAVPAMAADPALLSDSVSGFIQYTAAAVATVVVGLIGRLVQQFFGITMEARHREALHSALATGASLALSMIAELIAQGLKPDEARSVALQEGVAYVRQSVPSALRALKPDDDLLFNMMRAKAAQQQFDRNPAIVVTPTVSATPAGARG